MAALLADEQLAGRLHIAPRILAFGSEPTTADILARLDAAWGVRPANVYATTEAPIVAVSSPRTSPRREPRTSSCSRSSTPPAGRSPDGIPAPGSSSRTSRAATLPLIRYEIGDVVTPRPAPGPAGRPYRRLATVEGRSSDLLELPAVGAGRSPIHPFLGLGRPLPRSLTCAGSSSPAKAPRDRRGGRAAPARGPRRPRQAAGRDRAELEAAGAVAPPVAVAAVAAIARETGPGAKLKLVRAPR